MVDHGSGATLGVPGSEGITLMLDRPRQFSLNLWAFYEADRDLERQSGQARGTSDTLSCWLYGGFTTARALALVVAGLRQHDPSVTLEQVRDWVDFRDVDEAFETLAAQGTMGAEPSSALLRLPQDEDEPLPLRRGVVMLLDRPRRFSLPMGVCERAERELEVFLELPFESVQIIKDFVGRVMDATRLLVLLTAGLRRHDPSLTMEQVGTLVPPHRLPGVLTRVYEAWRLANPAPKPEAEAVVEEATPADPPSCDGASFGAEPAWI